MNTFFDVLNFLGSHHIKFTKGGFSDLIQFNQFKKKISNGKVVLMDEGKIIPQTVRLKHGIEFVLTEDMPLIDFAGNPYEKLEELYKEFKNSVPTPYSSYAKCNFVSERFENLTYENLINGGSRESARIRLEAFVMLTEFPWANEKHHYWQSPNDGDLILFREWSR